MMTSPASEHSEPPSTRPLLQDFDFDIPQKKEQLNVSLRALEDGDDSGSEFEYLRRQRRPGFWRRLRMSTRRRWNGVARTEDLKSAKSSGDEKRRSSQRFRWRRRTCFAIPLLVAFVFGIIYILNFFIGSIPLTWNHPAASSLDWTQSSQLLDITRNVTPVACHSHNDYWRRVPLYDALRWGCTGVEADVWLFDEELYVGHSTNALTANRTFRSMYIHPLVQLLEHQNPTFGTKNGIFPKDSTQTLVLLVDFKNDGRDIFPFVSSDLSALRERGYLTYFDGSSTIPGPITVVATGNAPFDLITANSTYRDIFFDAPLNRMAQDSTQHAARGGQGTVGTLPTSHFDSTNSYYASVNFRKSIGYVWWGRLSSKQLHLIREQIKGAHERGLKARYWSAPKWPVGLRNRIWRLFIQEGVDYLNGDDLAGMVGLDWGNKRHQG